MKLDSYIIHQGAPESYLLVRLGIDREMLSVVKWRGRKRSRDGVGKSPVAWRVSGRENVAKLCAGLIEVLGAKSVSARNSDEQTVLDRATRTLAAIRDREVREASASVDAAVRDSTIRAYVVRQFPIASALDIDSMMLALRGEELHSLYDLSYFAEETLEHRPSIWLDARKRFIKTMLSAVE